MQAVREKPYQLREPNPPSPQLQSFSCARGINASVGVKQFYQNSPVSSYCQLRLKISTKISAPIALGNICPRRMCCFLSGFLCFIFTPNDRSLLVYNNYEVICFYIDHLKHRKDFIISSHMLVKMAGYLYDPDKPIL